MPYEVCYRALLSISVVEGLKPHTHTRDGRRSGLRRAPAPLYNPLPRPALGGLSVFRFHPEDSLAGGPPARWFVILPEVREFIKDTRPKTNTTRGGRKAHRPTPKTRTIHPTVLPDR